MAINYITLRNAILGTLVLFSIAVLALGAAVEADIHGSIDFASLGIASAILTWLFVIPSYVLERYYIKGYPTSWTLVDLSWSGLLWILWLSTAAEASSVASLFTCVNVDLSSSSSTDCDDDIFGCIYKRYDYFDFDFWCQDKSKFYAFIAFSWFSWLLIFAYFLTLLTLSIRAHINGDTRVWFASVPTADWTSPHPSGQVQGQGQGQGGEKGLGAGSDIGGLSYGGSPVQTPGIVEYPPQQV